MSLGELALCEDFLDSHQEYAIDLLLSVKKLWVTGTERIAVLKRVKAGSVRYMVSPSTATSSGETLFRNSLVKGSTVTAGDSLRSQHAAWRARLAVMFSSSAQTPQQTKKLGRNASNLLGSEGRGVYWLGFREHAEFDHAQNPSMHRDLNSPGDRAPDTPSPLDAVLEENAPGNRPSPKTDLQLDPREGHGTGLTHDKAKGSGCPSVLAHSLETVKPAELLDMTGQVGGTATKCPSHGDDKTLAQALLFNEQE
ncbi:hypothetical protein EV363DRAFT_1487738 [Boletus edulis]|nr:hypothetical protein EV363DRAFT_1487738 [Boletus edulis]